MKKTSSHFIPEGSGKDCGGTGVSSSTSLRTVARPIAGIALLVEGLIFATIEPNEGLLLGLILILAGAILCMSWGRGPRPMDS